MVELSPDTISPWVSPCTILVKMDGSTSLISDYRHLNKFIFNESVPCTNLNQALLQVVLPPVFVLTDMTHGYIQLLISPRSQRPATEADADGHRFKPIRA